MFEKEFQEWFERNKKWLYSSDHMQAAYHAWCAGVQQQQAAQQPLALDGVEVCPICERVHSCFSPCGDCLATRPASKA